MCVLPSYLRAATQRERLSTRERERASKSVRTDHMNEIAEALSLSHSLVCLRFQEQQLRAHTCQLSYSFARMPKSATVKLPSAAVRSLAARSLSLSSALWLCGCTFGFI